MSIQAHIQRYAGPIYNTLREKISEQIELDIHFIAPSETLPFHTLVTEGMSTQAMSKAPAGMQYAELCILLPPDWPLSKQDLEDDIYAWPISWLRRIAAMPQTQNTWLGSGHTIPNGDDPQPLASNTELSCFMLLHSISLPHEFSVLHHEEKTIHFYCLYPLYKEEMNFKLQRGFEELLNRLDELGPLSDVVNTQRENVCSALDPEN